MIPWQRIVMNLNAAGMSRTAIARHIQSTPQTIGHISRGAIVDPRWSTGYALLQLHHKHCRDAHERDIWAQT